MLNKRISIILTLLSWTFSYKTSIAMNAEIIPESYLDCSINRILSMFHDDMDKTQDIQVPPEQACQITDLNLSDSSSISNDNLKDFIRLEKLDLSSTRKRRNWRPITDTGLLHMTTLTHLNLDFNDIITLKGISPLTNLQTLILGINTLASDPTFLTKLPHLLHLELGENNNIPEDIILQLTNLESLNFDNENAPSLALIGGFKQFHNLKELNLGKCFSVLKAKIDVTINPLNQDKLIALGSLMQLHRLSLGFMSFIPRDTIPHLNELSRLTNLQNLNNKNITREKPLSHRLENMMLHWKQAYEYVDDHGNEKNWEWEIVSMNGERYLFIDELCVLAMSKKNKQTL